LFPMLVGSWGALMYAFAERVWVKTPGEETAKAYAKEFPGWWTEGNRGEYLFFRAEFPRRAGLFGASPWPFGRRG